MGQIFSLNTILGKNIYEFPTLSPSDILVVDPVNTTSLVSRSIAAGYREQLSNQDFCEISYLYRCLERWLGNFLQQRGTIVTLMQPYHEVCHAQYPDMKINNYDWLRTLLPRDTRFRISRIEPCSFTLTEFGEDSPFGDYLRNYQHKVSVVAEGDFYPLAMVKLYHKMAAFTYRSDEGRIVFLPSSFRRDGKKDLESALKKACFIEHWPPPEASNEIEPDWLKTYSFPKAETLEKKLQEKQEIMAQLETECDKIYQHLLLLEYIQRNILAGNFMDTINAISRLFSLWHLSLYRRQDIITFAYRQYKGVILTAVCDEEAKLWLGEKLLRMCHQEGDAKGILVINAHRHQSPKERPAKFASDELEKFAQKHNLVLISVFDIFQAYSFPREDLLDLLFYERGSVKPPFDSWEKLPAEDLLTKNPLPKIVTY